MKKLMRILVISLVAAVLLSLAAVVYAETDEVGTVTANSLYVRTGAGTTNSILDTVHRGYTFTVGDTKDVNGTTWYKIPYGNISGWISGKYVSTSASLAPISSEAIEYDEPETLRVTGGTVNVRTGPGTAYSRITRVYYGNKFDALGEQTNNGRVWYYIDLGQGSYGWISSAYSTTGSVTPTQEEIEPDADYAYITGGSVNIRSGAGIGCPKIGLAHKGEMCKVLGSGYDSKGVKWYKISYSGGIGWVSSKYSAAVDGEDINIGGETADSEVEESGTIVITEDTVNVRKGAGTSYGILGRTHRGNQFNYTKYKMVGSTPWYYVTFNGQHGWISGKMATPLISPIAPADEDEDEDNDPSEDIDNDDPSNTTDDYEDEEDEEEENPAPTHPAEEDEEEENPTPPSPAAEEDEEEEDDEPITVD